MSYLPYIDYACPSGKYETNGPGPSRHFVHKYRILKPDFLVIDPIGDFHKEQVQNARAVGVEVFEMPRMFQWIPELGNPFGTKIEKTLSATRVRGDEVDPYIFEKAFLEVQAIKSIRADLYGPRRWFIPSNLLLPDKSRGQVPERLIKSIEYPTSRFQAWMTGSTDIPVVLKPEGFEDLREIELRLALREINSGI